MIVSGPFSDHSAGNQARGYKVIVYVPGVSSTTHRFTTGEEAAAFAAANRDGKQMGLDFPPEQKGDAA
jgi:hypothetical protein